MNTLLDLQMSRYKPDSSEGMEFTKALRGLRPVDKSYYTTLKSRSGVVLEWM